jgi:hypothetical protein
MDEFPKISISAARWLVLIGILLTSTGMLFNFQLQRHSMGASRVDFEWDFLEYTFLPVLLLGLLTTLIGSVTWARHAAIRRVTCFGFGIVILASLAFAIIPVNIHDWIAAFMIVFPITILLGVLLLLVAAVRAFIQRQHETSK